MAVKIKGEPVANLDELNDKITEALVNFVLRVAANENATPAELAALPGVAEIVCNRI